jgi:hypothetical protein
MPRRGSRLRENSSARRHSDAEPAEVEKSHSENKSQRTADLFSRSTVLAFTNMKAPRTYKMRYGTGATPVAQALPFAAAQGRPCLCAAPLGDLPKIAKRRKNPRCY